MMIQVDANKCKEIVLEQVSKELRTLIADPQAQPWNNISDREQRYSVLSTFESIKRDSEEALQVLKTIDNIATHGLTFKPIDFNGMTAPMMNSHHLVQLLAYADGNSGDKETLAPIVDFVNTHQKEIIALLQSKPVETATAIAGRIAARVKPRIAHIAQFLACDAASAYFSSHPETGEALTQHVTHCPPEKNFIAHIAEFPSIKEIIANITPELEKWQWEVESQDNLIIGDVGRQKSRG